MAKREFQEIGDPNRTKLLHGSPLSGDSLGSCLVERSPEKAANHVAPHALTYSMAANSLSHEHRDVGDSTLNWLDRALCQGSRGDWRVSFRVSLVRY